MTDRQRYFMMGNALVTFIINTLEPRLEEIIKAEQPNGYSAFIFVFLYFESKNSTSES